MVPYPDGRAGIWTVSPPSVASSSQRKGAAARTEDDIVALALNCRPVRGGEQFPGLLFRPPVARGLLENDQASSRPAPIGSRLRLEQSFEVRRGTLQKRQIITVDGTLRSREVSEDAGIRLAREKQVNTRVIPIRDAVEESVSLAHEVFCNVFRIVPDVIEKSRPK